MRVEVCRPHELGAQELERWRALAASDPGLDDPFLTPEFARLVDAVKPGARVAVVSDGGEIVAFLAYEDGRGGIARPIGAGVSDHQALIRAPDTELDHRALVRACGRRLWEFDHLREEDVPGGAHAVTLHASPYADVSAGYAAYLEDRRRSGRVRGTLRKGARLAEAEPELWFAFDHRDRALLAQLTAWKSEQYRRTGRRDRFAQRWIAALVDALFESRAPECCGTLSVLAAGDRPVAMSFGPRSRNVVTWWFPAYDPGFARFSAGLVLFLRVAEAAAGEGVARLDLGRGDEDYKASLKSRELRVAQGALAGGAAGAALARRRDPWQRAEAAVLARPALRRTARRVLSGAGRVRTATARRGSSDLRPGMRG